MNRSSKDDYIKVRVGSEVKERLDHESEVQHRSMSEIVRMALNEYLKKPID